MKVIKDEIKGYLLQRQRHLASLSLQEIAGPSEAFLELPPTLLGFLSERREEVVLLMGEASWRQEVLASMAEAMAVLLQGKNQFIVLGDQERHALRGLYQALLEDIREALMGEGDLSEAIRGAFTGHQARLAAFIGERGCVLASPASKEYSPELQLRILGLKGGEMREPILDMGCGRAAELVLYLRGLGKEAYGVDRAGVAGPYITQGEWLEFPLRGPWGTVVSHMAFSNHFIHHHLRPDGQAERYARRYMEVLRSLLPGGRFVYAPGLPFMEDLLPQEEYAVRRLPVEELLGGPVDRGLQAALGRSVLYSCAITRRGT